MTEIPMPGDYGTTQPPPQPKKEGCCSQCCKCLVCLVVLIVVSIMTAVISLI
ncbi:MAG: hypothetical protein KAJ36_09310 [Candidatus Thorarchaeota archaeon]|nr:hypothetical protein [Candidatus Thorarchaeota archaeon]